MSSTRSPRSSTRRKRPIVIAAVAALSATLIGIPVYHALAADNGHDGSQSDGSFFSSSNSASDSSSPHAGGRLGAPGQPDQPGRQDNEAVSGTVWPAHGQAAFIETGQSQIQVGPNQHAAPIASVTKVMTAYLILRDHPLQDGEDGPTITLTAADVADTAHRRALQQSLVSIAAGEQLTERQALQALLLPSANNIAAVLAKWDAGSQDGFVDKMNDAARSLGMNDTRYTDPSGFDETTVSTAADQVRVVERAMSLSVFAAIVGTPSVTLPVAGTVHNTDTLLGQDGFVGVKTGSDNAAGGCFAFRAIRTIGGKQTTITGVVLGQPGSDQVAAGLGGARAMVDRIAGR